MKSILVSLSLLAGSLLGQAAVAETLSGTYVVQSAACQNGGLTVGETIVISATNTAFTYGIYMETQFGNGVSPQFEAAVGSFTSTGQGDVSYGIRVREVGAYSNNGATFTYSQTLLQGPNQPNDETTRAVRVSKSGNHVSLQDSEGSGLGQACILVQK